MKQLITPLAILAVSAGTSHASLIDEPFADTSDTSLNGNTTGEGLSGTWSSGFVQSPTTLEYGDLDTSGGSVDASNQQSFGAADVSAPLPLAEGQTLWFSVLVRTDDDSSGNDDAAFALGTDALQGSRNNNVPMTNSGSGIGFTIRADGIRAASWTAGSPSRSATVSNLGEDITYLVLGEINWGAGTDLINLYLPAEDLTYGAAVSSHSAALSQGDFDTVTFSAKLDSLNGIDEIRFGTSAAAVLPAAGPIPEPASLVLLGLGGLFIARRRRA